MNYAMIKKYCIANGEGIRTALFVSGCNLHCKGCFNTELQDRNYGQLYTKDTYQEIANTMNEHIDGLSILGGEPLSPYNIEEVLELIKQFKKDFPNKTIWLWTGYTYEYLMKNLFYIMDTIIKPNVSVLIDGPFVEELKDLNLQWRGSSNQRIIKFN